jgi:hypothetical protein
LSCPCSKAWRISSSLSSIVGIVVAFVQIVTRGLAAWNDGLEKIILVLFNEWHQVCLVVKANIKHLLPWVLYGLGMCKDVH